MAAMGVGALMALMAVGFCVFLWHSKSTRVLILRIISKLPCPIAGQVNTGLVPSVGEMN